MLKDIKETPEALKTLLNTYISKEAGVKNIKIPINPQKLDKIYIAASGSSRNAANTAKYFMEKITGVPVIVDFASEFAHRTPAISQNDLLILLSQSGETADVLAALKKAKNLNICTFAVINEQNSSISKLADAEMLVYAGKEQGIPATKSFTCQLMSLYLLGIYIAEQKKSFSSQEIFAIIQKLSRIPDKISENIDLYLKKATIAAHKIKDSSILIILGRGQNWAISEECALKIQETSYINAFGYPTGEFMHGHFAVLEENFPVLSLLTEIFDDTQSSILAAKNTRELREKRNPLIIAVGHAGIDVSADVFIEIEEKDKVITSFLTVVLIQLLAYKTAELSGKNTINPRSLKKSVLDE